MIFRTGFGNAMNEFAAQQAVAADRLRRGYAWRVLLSIASVVGVRLAKVGGG